MNGAIATSGKGISYAVPKRSEFFERYLTIWVLVCMVVGVVAWLFMQHLFTPWISPEMAKQYTAGLIILAAAPCTAMVFVWSYLTDGDPAYTLVQVAVNDLIMLVAFAPIVMFLCGVAHVVVPAKVLITSVAVFIVIPLAAGWITRTCLLKSKGQQWFDSSFLPRFHPIMIGALLLTLVLIFAFQAENLTQRWIAALLVAVPIIIQVYFNSGLAYGLMRLLRVEHSVKSRVVRLSAETMLMLILPSMSWAGAAEESHNPPFSIQQQEQTYWLVKPNGDRFFSFGVCCVNQGASNKEWDSSNPGYAAGQHYSATNTWAIATLKRLKAWGFITLGGWSDFQTLKCCRDADVAFAPVLHIGATAGAPWWDMWDPRVLARMDQVAKEGILPLRDDSRVIGYYTDNEIGWWNAILFKETLEQAPTSGQRQRLIQLLRQTYRNDWSALMQDFEPAPIVETWEELERHGMLYLRPGGSGIRVEREFLGLLAERYYSLVHNLVRKYDRRALILGDRFPSFYYPEVVRAAAPYVDALSCNLNPTWNDGSFARYQLETLHELSGKPLIIGEFYMAARENRSGNKNSHGTYPVVATQKERGAGFRTTLQTLLKTPSVIGADWFQYYDQPTHGRFDGENFNFGLVDIDDRPYGAITSVAANLDLIGLRKHNVRVRPDATQGVPPAPRHPFDQFEPTLALKHWDRERGFVTAVSKYPLADLYICWDRKALYLGLCAQDLVEDVFYRGKTVPSSDRAEWIVSIGGLTKSIRGHIGAGMEPVFDEPCVRSVSLSGINGNARSITGLELPAKLFGKGRLSRGDTIQFSSTFLTHCLAYRVDWNGQFFLRGN